ncbi:hypothetical protein P5673_010738 [Acropora cervicornis]|uniref:Uncharacterized protein n=1 Tax=Acropora cervicornis TaxID=6130 RepID=A0AAD9V9D7_ACRCE|nr:hypothetical protein P5673_010738 [Acropora cervicornis]
MQYFLKSLVTKRAKDAIEKIDAVGEAYPEAIGALKARFNRPQAIHRTHARALLNVKPSKDGSSAELRQLHDTLQHHLRSMKVLGQLDFERFITALGESNLNLVAMTFTQKEKEVPDYHQLLEFLDLRLTATELTTHYTDHKKPQASCGKFKTNPSGSIPRPVSVYATSAQTRCPACSSSRHCLAYCENFKEKTLAEKRDFVLAQGLMFNCLKLKHIGKHCPSPNTCLKCNKRHQIVIHVDNVNMERAPEVPKQTTSSAVLSMDPKELEQPKTPYFRWVLFGNVSSHQSTSEFTTLHASTSIPSCEETLQKFWTLEEPPKAMLPLLPLDKLVIQDFKEHHRREESGHFIVKLPFKPQRPTLGKSKLQALRLQHDSQFSDYAKVINEYLTLGHAKRVPDDDLKKTPSDSFCLAHHAVYKDSATTPLRIVFDGSMKSTSGVSLNAPHETHLTPPSQ